MKIVHDPKTKEDLLSVKELDELAKKGEKMLTTA